MQKWEYCVFDQVEYGFEPMNMRGAAALYKLTDKGAELVVDVETICKGLPKGSKLTKRDILGQIIAQLGGDGWEMVGTGVTGMSGHTLYFKRPKE